MILNFDSYYKIQVVGNICKGINEYVATLSNVKDTIVILTGDTNLGTKFFNTELEDLLSIEYSLVQNNNYIVFIRGNYDNPSFFKKKSTFKNELADNAEHVILLPDYSVINVGEHSILCVGGGRSLDKVFRIKDLNYWSGETINAPSNDIISSIDDFNIDIVISHEAPLEVFPVDFRETTKDCNSYLIESFSMYDTNLKKDIFKGRKILSDLYEDLNTKNEIKYWYYSHYEKSNETVLNKTKFISLNIKDIKSIN